VKAGNILLSVYVHRFKTFIVEFSGIDKPLHNLLDVCPACKDKVEIKCMGSASGKTPTKPKLYLLFPNLGHMEQDEFDVVCFVQLCLSGKIRRLSMNVVFTHIWQKRVEFLN
jgi:hypothetical protein